MTSTATPTSRSRIEGSLHRSLAAQVSVRSADEGAKQDDGLLRLQLSVSSETPYLRQSWWDDPWVEVLGHSADEVDLSRYNGGAAVLANHDRSTAVGNTPLAAIGAIERAWVEKGQLHCDIVVSRREALADLRQDIKDGLVKNVSVGYMINERVLTRQGKDGEPSEYRVTSWTPFEVSLVDIPADATVGLGRSADAQPGYRVIDLAPQNTPPAAAVAPGATPFPTPPAEGNTQGTRSMTTATATPSAAAPGTETRVDAIQNVPPSINPVAAERDRVKEINALGRTFGAAELATRAIEDGTGVDGFRAMLLQAQVDGGKLKRAESPEIGLSRKEAESYSFVRLLNALHEPHNARKLAPFEMECSEAAQAKRRSAVGGHDRSDAFTVPTDMLGRSMQLTEGQALSARNLLGAQGQMQRDLVVGTNTAGGHTVATDLLGSSFIEMLRNALVLDRMGVTMLRDLNGDIAIPGQTGAATGYWVTEGNAPTESQQTFGKLTLTPKTVGAYTDYSRKLLIQSSIDVEAFVRADLAAVVAQTILAAAINGSGSGAEPTGLLNFAGLGSVAMGTNGGAPTYDMLVDLESAVANSNAAIGTLAYLTNTRVRGKLRKTQVFSGTNGAPVWGVGRETGLGDVMGYDAYVTNAVPNTLTKGTASGVCSAAVFGNWADWIIGMWGGLDLMLDPYANATSGGKRIIALQDLDMGPRRVASFAVVKDITTT